MIGLKGTFGTSHTPQTSQTFGLNLSNSNLREVDVEFFGEPKAGIVETEVRIVHHQVDGATTGITDVTAVAVAGGRERQ